MSTTIFVELLDEGVDVWRPVVAEELGPEVFLIPAATKVPCGEKWQFSPGATVRCELKRLSRGVVLVAVQQL